jgi:hypothetical protein
MTPPAASAAGRALPRTAVPRAPRRVSGPAPRRRQGASSARSTRAGDPFAVRALRRGRLLADSRLLDRLIRGRLWVPLVAAGLMGIVFMQVTMLKFNSGIGRAVQTASTLERQNSDLRSEVSRMESGDRIDQVAGDLGMVVPAAGGDYYVRAGASDTAEVAARHMTAPGSEALARTQQATASTGATGTGTATTAVVTTATTPTTPVSTPAATATATTAATTTPAAPATTPTTPVTQTQTQQTPAAPASTPTQAPPTPAATTPPTAPAGATVAPSTPSATTAAATSGGSAAPAGN